MAISKVHMLVLLEHDLPAAITFYQKLGLQLIFELKDQWAELIIDSIKIGLCPVKQELPDRRPGIVLQVDDLVKFYDEHKANVSFLSEPVFKVHGIMVSFKDPGNNIIDLYQPTPEKVKEFVDEMKKQEKCCEGKSESCVCKLN
jgi:hypothetical protein